MKTKIFTLISAFSFAISSAECSEKMINGGVVQVNSGSIEYGYNDTGVELIHEENLCITPIMERRQGLPKTPPSPGKKSPSDVKKHKISKKSKYERRRGIFVLDDVDGSIYTYKAFNPISFNEDLEEDIYKTPVMERRQGLPRISNALMTPTIKRNEEVSLRRLPMPPSFSDFVSSIDGDKALNIRALGPSDFITPVKKRTKKVPSYQRPLSMLSANVACVRHQNHSFSDQLSLQNGLFTPTKRFKRSVSYTISPEERASLCRRLFQ